MRNDIRVAGMGLSWSEQYATSYSSKLKEMDFSIRIYPYNDNFLIAYSHKSFTVIEGEEVLKDLLGKSSNS